MAHVVMDTLGVFLSTNTSFNVHNRAERIMNVIILLLSILTSRFLTVILLQYMLATETDSGVDTLRELGQLNIPIFISYDVKRIMDDYTQNIP